MVGMHVLCYIHVVISHVHVLCYIHVPCILIGRIHVHVLCYIHVPCILIGRIHVHVQCMLDVQPVHVIGHVSCCLATKISKAHISKLKW